MTATKTFLLQYAVVIEVPAEPSDTARAAEFHMRNQLHDAITELFRDLPDYLGLQTERVTLIDESSSTGQCSRCRLWVTNVESPSALDGLCRGVRINEQWYCEDHKPRKYRRKHN